MRTFFLLAACLLTALAAGADDFLPGIQRILFLGDSITQSGQYVDDFEAFLFTKFPKRHIDVMNLGLASETVSGLSEQGHAGGKFPRPDLAERIDRILAKTKPDLVFACYGMNDGIYLPLDETRFAKFREGMTRLHEKVAAAGAQIIHLTPPTFDLGPHPAEGKFNYNDVLDRYSAWLLEQRANGWRVIDIHGPMNAELARHRAADPGFYFSKDGVHPSPTGHRVIARALIDSIAPSYDLPLRAYGFEVPKGERQKEFFELIHQRGRILGDAWLTDTGHLRPGIAKGLPIDEAKAKADESEKRIRELAAKHAAELEETHLELEATKANP